MNGSATWQLDRGDVELGERLGSGHFGDVFRGKLARTGEAVAVKTCRDTATDSARFLDEADILKDLDHPNVVRVVGVVEAEPACIVLELCAGGDLSTHLREHASLDTTQVTAIAPSSARAHACACLVVVGGGSGGGGGVCVRACVHVCVFVCVQVGP